MSDVIKKLLTSSAFEDRYLGLVQFDKLERKDATKILREIGAEYWKDKNTTWRLIFKEPIPQGFEGYIEGKLYYYLLSNFNIDFDTPSCRKYNAKIVISESWLKK